MKICGPEVVVVVMLLMVIFVAIMVVMMMAVVVVMVAQDEDWSPVDDQTENGYEDGLIERNLDRVGDSIDAAGFA